MTEIKKNIHTQMALCVFEDIKKDSLNPMFNKKDSKPNYASIGAIHDAILPELHKNGLYYSAFETIENHGFLCVRITHPESGTYIETFTKLLNMSDMQKYIASCTYARKNSLCNLCGLSSKDDDGNTASEQQNTRSNPVTQAFKPIEMPADQLAKLKEDLLGLWEMKKEVAAEKFPVRATNVSQILTNDFTKTTESGEVVSADSVDLIKIQTWLKGL